MSDHPDRKSVRLRDITYTERGAYFVTICTNERKKIFGNVIEGQMIYSKWGNIAHEEVQITNDLRRESGIQIKKYVIMPNHVHFIVEISRCNYNEQLSVGTQRAVSDERSRKFSVLLKQSIPTVIRSYKSAVTKRVRESIVNFNNIDGHSTLCPYKNSQISVWQPRYFEHIIRNNVEYKQIWEYVENNPYRWDKDKFYL